MGATTELRNLAETIVEGKYLLQQEMTSRFPFRNKELEK